MCARIQRRDACVPVEGATWWQCFVRVKEAKGVDALVPLVVRDTGPGRARQVSSSSSIQPVGLTICLGLLVGWTVCLGLRAGPSVVRYAGPGRARWVCSSSSIQLVGLTACPGRRAGLAVVRDAGPPQVPFSSWAGLSASDGGPASLLFASLTLSVDGVRGRMHGPQPRQSSLDAPIPWDQGKYALADALAVAPLY